MYNLFEYAILIETTSKDEFFKEFNSVVSYLSQNSILYEVQEDKAVHGDKSDIWSAAFIFVIKARANGMIYEESWEIIKILMGSIFSKIPDKQKGSCEFYLQHQEIDGPKRIKIIINSPTDMELNSLI